MRWIIASLIVGATVLVFAAPASAGALILQVPDWNQPDVNEYGNDGLPAHNSYPYWCSPTAGGNIMGYWEDVKGCVGLTDRKVFNATTNYPGTPGTWEQGLYHDGMIEMGWFMDTGGWQEMAPPMFPPGGAGGTHVAKILPGLISYAQASWTDNDYPFPNLGSGIVKVAYPNVAGFTEAVGGTGLAAMWITYTNQINLGHPVEVSFDRWVSADTGGTVSVNGQTVHEWSWASSVEDLGHSVVGVGYFTDAQTNKWFICQDGLSATQQYVAVPVDAKWVENDYITAVPEPTTFVLLLVGTVSALIYGWRRHGMA